MAKQPQPIEPLVRHSSWPPEELWEGSMETYTELVRRSQFKDGSKPLAPPQGKGKGKMVANVPGIRIAFMNLGGGEPGFKTSPIAQRNYQKELIGAIRTLISDPEKGDMHVIAITGLNDFWFEFLKDKIPCWRFIHDGGTASIGYDKVTCKLKEPGKRESICKESWRTYFGAIFDVGNTHPYHLLAVVSRVEPNEAKILYKDKEKDATDAMCSVLLHPSIVAGLEDSSTCVHIVGDWGIFDWRFTNAIKSTKQKLLAVNNSLQPRYEFSKIWDRHDFGSTWSKEGWTTYRDLEEESKRMAEAFRKKSEHKPVAFLVTPKYGFKRRGNAVAPSFIVPTGDLTLAPSQAQSSQLDDDREVTEHVRKSHLQKKAKEYDEAVQAAGPLPPPRDPRQGLARSIASKEELGD